MVLPARLDEKVIVSLPGLVAAKATADRNEPAPVLAVDVTFSRFTKSTTSVPVDVRLKLPWVKVLAT